MDILFVARHARVGVDQADVTRNRTALEVVNNSRDVFVGITVNVIGSCFRRAAQFALFVNAEREIERADGEQIADFTAGITVPAVIVENCSPDVV